MGIAFTTVDYYKKNKYWYDHANEERAYWLISPFPDGNCGLYAFACGLIDMIIMDKLTLNTERFSVFRGKISENFLVKNLGSLSFKELNVDFFNFSLLIGDSNLTFTKFKAFLAKQTHQGIAAITLALTQPLRAMGLSQYEKLLSEKNKIAYGLPNEDIHLLENGSFVGEDILSSLASFFGIDVRLIGEKTGYRFEAPLREGTTPLFSLLNQADHWHYLLPTTQISGLAKILPFLEDKPRPPLQRKHSQILLQGNQQLLQEIEKDYTKIQFFSKEILNTLSEKLKQIFDHLKTIFNDPANNSNEFKTAAKQADNAAKNSTEVLNSLRQTWRHNSNELDTRLTKLGLKPIEISLIKTPLITDHSEDAALAAVIQNAEIADFLSRNYNTLTSFNRVPISTLQNPISPPPAIVCH